MTAHADWFEQTLSTQAMVWGTVTRIAGDGTVVVAERELGCETICEMLHTGRDTLVLAEGDEVLIWREARDGRGVVIGKRGPYQETPGRSLHAPQRAAEPPEVLVLEATHSLTLRVGDGSITIREDGKILIKGKDLVSHAQRMNRIKGGAVSIN